MILWDFFWILIWYCFVGAYLVMVARGSGTTERQVGGDPIAGAEAIEVGTGPGWRLAAPHRGPTTAGRHRGEC